MTSKTAKPDFSTSNETTASHCFGKRFNKVLTLTKLKTGDHTTGKHCKIAQQCTIFCVAFGWNTSQSIETKEERNVLVLHKARYCKELESRKILKWTGWTQFAIMMPVRSNNKETTRWEMHANFHVIIEDKLKKMLLTKAALQDKMKIYNITTNNKTLLLRKIILLWLPDCQDNKTKCNNYCIFGRSEW